MKINSLIIDTLKNSRALFAYEIIIKSNIYKLDEIANFLNDEFDNKTYEYFEGKEFYKDYLPYKAFIEKGYVLIEPQQYIYRTELKEIDYLFKNYSDDILSDVLKELENNYKFIKIEKTNLELDILKAYERSPFNREKILYQVIDILKDLMVGDFLNAYFYKNYTKEDLEETINILSLYEPTKVLAIDIKNITLKIIDDYKNSYENNDLLRYVSSQRS